MFYQVPNHGNEDRLKMSHLLRDGHVQNLCLRLVYHQDHNLLSCHFPPHRPHLMIRWQDLPCWDRVNYSLNLAVVPPLGLAVQPAHCKLCLQVQSLLRLAR